MTKTTHTDIDNAFNSPSEIEIMHDLLTRIEVIEGLVLLEGDDIEIPYMYTPTSTSTGM